MSAEVALEYLRKLRLCKEKDYSYLDSTEKIEMVFALLGEQDKKITRKQDRKVQRNNEKEYKVRELWPGLFQVFPNSKVVGYKKA